MGMFNSLTCKTRLPGEKRNSDLANLVFQTKTLGELNMDIYRIRCDGLIELKAWHLELTGKWYVWGEKLLDPVVYVDPPTDPNAKGGHPLDFLEGTIPHDGPFEEFKKIEDGWKKFDFTGDFSFYAASLMFFAHAENGVVLDIIKGKRL